MKYSPRLEDLVQEFTADLGGALEDIKTLEGIIPICFHCKKNRDDQGYWSQLESYMKKHSDANFSHSIYPDGLKKYYPGVEI